MRLPELMQHLLRLADARAKVAALTVNKSPKSRRS